MSRPPAPHLSHRLRILSLSSPPATALFYARLHAALVPSHAATHLLALCLLQAGETYSALHLVRDGAEPSSADPAGCYACALVVGKCCDILKRYSEGQEVLARATERVRRLGGDTSLTVPSPAETTATASLLLATLAHKSNAPGSSAPEHYLAALADEPWLWEAFTGLCDMVQADSVFADPPRPRTRHATHSPGLASARPEALFARRQLSPLASPPSNGLFTPDPAGAGSLGMLGNPGAWDASSVMGDTTFPTIEPVAASRRPLPSISSSLLPASSHTLATLRATTTPAGPSSTETGAAKPPAMKRARGTSRRADLPTPSQPSLENGHGLGALGRAARTIGRDLRFTESNGDKDARRSTRLTSAPPAKLPPPRATKPTRATRSRSTTSSTSGQTGEAGDAAAGEAAAQASADDWLRDIVRRCGRAYAALASYRCRDALNELDGLPAELQVSPWALDIAARAFYEMANYVFARRAFSALLEAEPYRVAGLELYSTTLWHLGDAVALSHLSQSLLAVSRDLAPAWVAAGNALSLQRAPDEATRCFRRATQLAPGGAYAWTLAGHEAVEMEEHERALGFFRAAVRCDARHYNAWYGLGLVYLRTGKPRHAEHHFRRAAEINPTNAVLWCCIGDDDDFTGALAMYERALACAPDSAMVKYKRARALVALGENERAIAALDPLAREAPDEAQVFFLLGKCLMRAGRGTEAAVALTSARELQPKLERAIRAVMLSNGEDEDEE